MVASCQRSKGARRGLFGCCLLALGLVPAPIAHQELGALLARQPEVSQRWRAHVLATPFDSVRVAGFNFPRPVGTAIPALNVRHVSLNSGLDEAHPDARGATVLTYIHPLELPQVNRGRKGDRLAPPRPPVLLGASDISAYPVPSESFPRPPGDLALPFDGPDDETGLAGAAADAKDSQTVARKGEITGAEQRPKTPAERLNLNGQELARSKRCLAEAIYFEARSEPKRGQLAVAQVVMNRVFSQFYPANVCDVVFQNAHRRLACQFTFACDGTRRVFTEPELWTQAQQIARDTLEGTVWVPEVGKSTHYHANYVHPYWVRSMRRNARIGVHIFYRPRRWGDGAEEPHWGPGVTTPSAPTAQADAGADQT